jgi:hypothetical protein
MPWKRRRIAIEDKIALIIVCFMGLLVIVIANLIAFGIL